MRKGFSHDNKAFWVLGVPIYGVTADGVTIAHEDGNGWFVNVTVKMPLVGKLVEYRGDVYVSQ
jgi:hypothetical protein